jgi:DNA-binding XRE family transcriptional regulator
MEIKRETASEDLLFFREATGYTQEYLAHKTGVSRGVIIAIEKGSVKPQAKTLFKLNKYIKKIG